ncbi:Ger(x)C family spore germination protein [Paenibacillus xylanilyticus]|uniref:Ger(x)C family spore germination protein n=1 Tax=Paenibacillus xylanilyticus TaxID=248903 RepID=UPI003AADCB90
MKRLSQWMLAVMCVMGLLLLSSCQDTSIVNEISLVLTSAYDLQDKRIHNSVLIGEYTEKDKSDVELLEIDSTNSFDVLPRMNMQAKEPIEYGQLRMMVLGEDYAKHGIGDILRVLSHNTRVSRRMQFAVAEGKALDIIKASIPAHDPLYLMKLIEQNGNFANLPHFSLHQTLFQYFSKGQDIYLPRLRLNDQDKIMLDGLVVFKGEKAVLQLSDEEGLCLKLLTEDAKNGKFLAQINEVEGAQRQTANTTDNDALIKILSSLVKHRMRSDTPAAALESKIHISASVVKASRNDFLLSGKEMKELESEMKRHMEAKINQLIRKCQRENVDPFGFGEYVRSCTHHWDNETFYKDYGSMDIRAHVELTLVQDGIQE